MRTFIRALATLIVLGLTASQPAMAHKIHIFAYYDNGIVYAECYFSDGKPVAGAVIRAVDADNLELTAGETDQQGLFSFPYIAHSDVTLQLDASMGHRSSFNLEVPKRTTP